jgi:LCP family protein required for cell wall assembly
MSVLSYRRAAKAVRYDDRTVMEDIEAYGQLRDRPLPAPGAAPKGAIPAPPGVFASPRRQKRSHWLRNSILLMAGYFFLAAATTVQPLPLPLVDARVSAPFPGGAPVLFGLPDRPFTVVVIGLDRRPTETGASRADTILVVRIDPNSHEAAFLSIPRDAMLEIPAGDGSFFRDRINTAFVYNYSSEDEGAAPRAVMDTIEHNFGIDADHYVIFDQYNAKDLIDAMGGVTIDNPREFGQDNYSDDDINVIPQYFPQGKLKLDGYEAVAYGRIREGSSDFDRIERQQRVGSALIDRASSPFSVVRLPFAFGAFRDTIQTDMSLRQSAGVLAMLKRVPDDELKTKSLGDAAVSCVSCTASIQLLDPQKTAQIIAEAFGDEAAGQLAAELLVAAGVTP